MAVPADQPLGAGNQAGTDQAGVTPVATPIVGAEGGPPATSTPQGAPQEVRPSQGDVRELADGSTEMYVIQDKVGQWTPTEEAANRASYQAHNTREAQRIAAERRELQEERAQLLLEKKTLEQNGTAPSPEYFDELISGEPDDGNVGSVLMQEVNSLKQEIASIKKESVSRNRLSAFETGIAQLEQRYAKEGFNRAEVEARINRLDSKEANSLRHPKGYELMFLRMKTEGTVAPPTLNPPASERVRGPSSSQTATPRTGPLNSIRDLAAELECLPGFQRED